MSYPVMPLGFLGSQGDNDTYRIERSLRFNSADSAYLNRTPASAGNRKTWTWSGWVKVGALSTERIFLSNTDTSGRYGLYFGFRIPNTLEIGDYGFSSFDWVLTTSALFRDTSAWYHIVASIDTTQATASNRVRLYVNGSQINSFSASTYPSQNADLQINSTSPMSIGRVNNNSFFYDGYITEVYFIDGQALTPSSFGETDAITGRWKAKAYSGTYGTNGFYLKFADNSGTTATTLGKDSSGNGNNWTPNNFSVTAGAGNDSLVDSPTNYGTDTGVGGEVRGNYATWNPLSPSGYVFSNGNLDVVGSGANNQNYPLSNLTASSGKWYFECTSASMGTDPMVGISDIAKKYSIVYGKAGGIAKGDVITYTTLSTKSSFTGGDIIGIAVNADSSTVAFYKNNVLQDTINFSTASMVNTDWYAVCYSSSNPTTTWTINFGQRPFAYTAPTGFKALCTANLSTPTIRKPSSYMDVVTYTGNGSNGRVISGLNFSPDLVWTKSRSAAYDHALSDTVRGIGFALHSNTTAAEDTAYGLSGVGVGNYTINAVNQLNENSVTYVAWAWDAGESSSTNTDGSITSTVRVNAQAGVSIVSFTANASNTFTVGHSLGIAPKMIITKGRNQAYNWVVYHSSIGAGKFLWLNSANASASSSLPWAGTSPTSSVFSSSGNGTYYNNGDTLISYCFAEVEGFSKFGSYTGNGSADGPFVWCGFRPRWVLTKNASTGGAGYNWMIWDTSRDSFNEATKVLSPDLSNAEYATSIDALSNGFKMRNSGATANANGSTHIFAAFAESPFKYSRAR